MAFYSDSPVRMFGVSHVTASLGANHPELGTRMIDGASEYIWVYNAGGEDIDPGLGAVLVDGAAAYSCTVSSVTAADILIGVAKHNTLTTATYGWLLTRGITEVEMMATSGTVAAGDLLELGANGLFHKRSNTTANGPVCGKALDAIVSSASGSAYISVY